MIFLGLIFIFFGYLVIGMALSVSWFNESYENNPDNFDSSTFLFKCMFKWPSLLVNKDRR